MIREAVLEFIRRRSGYCFPRLGRTAYDVAFRLAPKQIRTELVPGIFADLDLSDEVQRATYWEGGRYEQPTLQLLEQWVHDGATHFFDIGSNYGFFSLALLARQPKLHVYAFEPNPLTCARLAKIKTENRLDQLDVNNLGLSDECARLTLHRGLATSAHSTFGDHPELRASETDLVEVVDFETWRNRAGLDLPPPGCWIAKVDVEGFEVNVLSGLRRALEARAFRGLVVEIHPFTLGICGAKPDEVYSLMQTAGYEPLPNAHGALRRSFHANQFFVPRERLPS